MKGRSELKGGGNEMRWEVDEISRLVWVGLVDLVWHEGRVMMVLFMDVREESEVSLLYTWFSDCD